MLREALRVTKGSVLIWESVYDTPFDRRVLALLDRWANRLRSGGLMSAQEAHLDHRTVEEWVATVRRCADQLPVAIEVHRFGLFPHKQVLIAAHRRPLLQR